MTKCPSCEHDDHEAFCPQCGCEDYGGKRLTAQVLQERPGPPPAPDICRECGHAVGLHDVSKPEIRCCTTACDCTGWGLFPSGKCAVCGKPLDDHKDVHWCSY